MSVVGIFGLVSKLHSWNESAVFFDGTSLGTFDSPSADAPPYAYFETAAYVFCIVVYLTVTIPSLRAIAEPTKEEVYNDQVMAMRVLSAGNIIIIGSLLLILALQVRGLIR